MVNGGATRARKIVAQCRVDMPRIGAALGWDPRKKNGFSPKSTHSVLPAPADRGADGRSVDLANEFWLMTLRHRWVPARRVGGMDFIDPASLIRKKGNLKISLTIDAPLQKAARNAGRRQGIRTDRMVASDVRVAVADTVVARPTRPHDTLHAIRVLREPIDFREPSSAVITSLSPGDTVFDTVTYKRIGHGRYRRYAATWWRREVLAPGQYFAYAIIDSRTGKLPAYYSKDKLGSRLACLLHNRVPNGSSTAKPIFNALNFDIGSFMPYSKWSDSVEVLDNVPWRRMLSRKSDGALTGVVFLNSAVPGRGYPAHNHNDVFEGCRYIFDLLASSNNILGIESAYRLNRRLFDAAGDVASDAFPLVQYCYRIGAFSRVKDTLGLKTMTGVRAYKELVRLAGVDEDRSQRPRENSPWPLTACIRWRSAPLNCRCMSRCTCSTSCTIMTSSCTRQTTRRSC